MQSGPALFTFAPNCLVNKLNRPYLIFVPSEKCFPALPYCGLLFRLIASFPQNGEKLSFHAL